MLPLTPSRLSLLALLLASAAAGQDVPTAEFRARREALAAAIGTGVVSLGAHKEDRDLRYVQENNYWYLTGVGYADTAILLVIKDGKITREVLYLAAKNRQYEAWNGVRPSAGKEAEERFGFAASAANARRIPELEEALAECPTLVTTADGGFGRGRGAGRDTGRDAGRGGGRRGGADAASQPALQPGGEPASRAASRPTRDAARMAGATPKEEPVAALVERLGNVEVRAVASFLGDLRLIKSAAEIEQMRKTCEASCAAMIEGWSQIKPGAWEYEVQAVVECGFRRRRSVTLAYPSIVGSGPNSCYLHYSANERQMQDGEVVLMDVGAKVGYYSADLTRTVPVSGKFTPRQREIYQIVLDAQKAAFAVVKPGAPFHDVHAAALKVITDAGYARYFIHGTSHQLGLDVHDPMGRRAGTLQPGMVFTIEPGIYIQDEALGVRIEDDVLVTEGGYEHLTRFAPREADEIEAMMARLRADGVAMPDGRKYFPAATAPAAADK